MGDATARLDAALLGLDGFVVVATAEVGGELELLVETTADLVGCPRCGAVARAKDRRPTWVRDLPLGGGGCAVLVEAGVELPTFRSASAGSGGPPGSQASVAPTKTPAAAS